MDKRTTSDTPETLIGAVRYFADPDVALHFLAGLRWPEGPVCPHCGSAEAPSFLKTRRIWKCRDADCRKQFSVKVGTVFEDSPIGLDKWLPCLWMIANCKNGISSYEVARALGVTQKSAWFMLHRIRLAMQTGTFGKIGGEVEVDETFIGGKARFMHKEKRARVIGGKTGLAGKVAVIGVLKRADSDQHSTVRASVIKSRSRVTLHGKIHENVERGASVYTDAFDSYRGLAADFDHGVVDHGFEYVKGKVHTNGLENFWSLLKRSLAGTYVSVEPFHMFRYLDEQVFRFNNRKTTDGSRFLMAARSIVGKRLTYKALIGAGLPALETC
jgi:transposase-like protein